MKKKKKNFLFTKEVIIWSCAFAVLLLLAIIFWKPSKGKLDLYKEWRSFQNYQRYKKEDPYTWGEYMEYLERKEDSQEKQRQFIRDWEKSYYDDAQNSLGGNTPEEAYDMLRDALRDNDLERALSLSFVDDRESAREALQPYADKGELPSLIEKWDLDDMDCGESVEDTCGNEYGFYPCRSTLGCSAPDVEFEGVEYRHTIEFVKNVLDKWQLEDY